MFAWPFSDRRPFRYEASQSIGLARNESNIPLVLSLVIEFTIVETYELFCFIIFKWLSANAG